jgi:hypothetical protein
MNAFGVVKNIWFDLDITGLLLLSAVISLILNLGCAFLVGFPLCHWIFIPVRINLEHYFVLELTAISCLLHVHFPVLLRLHLDGPRIFRRTG